MIAFLKKRVNLTVVEKIQVDVLLDKVQRLIAVVKLQIVFNDQEKGSHISAFNFLFLNSIVFHFFEQSYLTFVNKDRLNIFGEIICDG